MSETSAVHSQNQQNELATPVANSPVVYRNFVLKVDEACDIACRGCYIYDSPGGIERRGNVGMTPAVATAAARRIGEYAAQNQLDQAEVVAHGGEPTLRSPEELAFIAQAVYGAMAKVGLPARFSMQSNGIRLGSDRWGDVYAQTLADNNIVTAISLDGYKEANDLHRLTRGGASTYEPAMAGMRRLQQEQYKKIFGGVLTVADLRTDPKRLMEWALENNLPAFDVLLPHGNWENPPPGLETAEARANAPYGEWLKTLFDAWWDSGRKVPIRFFDSIFSLLNNGPSLVESLGPSPVRSMVIGRTGMIEQVDTLRSTYDGAVDTGLNVLTHSLSEAAAKIESQRQRLGMAVLSNQCKACPYGAACAGGLETHRYAVTADGKSTFGMPSVYTHDLFALFKHMEMRGIDYIREQQYKRAQQQMRPSTEVAF